MTGGDFSDNTASNANEPNVETRGAGTNKGPAGGVGAVEPSVGSDPSSGQKPFQKQQGADRPEEEPSEGETKAVTDEKAVTEGQQATGDSATGAGDDGDSKDFKKDPNDKSGEPLGSVPHGGQEEKKGEEGPQGASKSEGTGEQWVKTSGLAADGGDFDATKPGAGREADRKCFVSECQLFLGVFIVKKIGTNSVISIISMPSLSLFSLPSRKMLHNLNGQDTNSYSFHTNRSPRTKRCPPRSRPRCPSRRHKPRLPGIRRESQQDRQDQGETALGREVKWFFLSIHPCIYPASQPARQPVNLPTQSNRPIAKHFIPFRVSLPVIQPSPAKPNQANYLARRSPRTK